jgi:hypothetical protein
MWLGPNGPNWLAMVIYDRGRFWIEGEAENRRLRYDLRSLHGMVFCLAGAAMFFAIAQAHGGPLNGVAVSGAAFGWLYGMNLVLALIRIPQAIRRAVRQD